MIKKADISLKNNLGLYYFNKAEKYWYWVLIFAFAFFIIQSIVNIWLMLSWLDEAKYFMKGFWYVTGQVLPYSHEDATGYPPMFFYELGWWQQIFGIGIYTVRIFSLCAGLLNLGVLYVVSNEIFKSKIQAAITVLILATNPVVVKYFSTATPFAIVSLISLVTFYILVKQNKYNWIISSALLGLCYFLLFFHRTNMIIGIVFFMIFQLLSAEKLKFRRILVSLGIAAILTIWLLNVFPDNLSFIALDLPLIKTVLLKIGLINNPYKLFNENTFSAVVSTDNTIKGLLYRSVPIFLSFYIKPFFLIVILSTISLYASIREKIISKPIGFAAIYFIVMSVTHFLGSQGYCPKCILAYTNYFIVFGALSASYGVMYLFKASKSSVSDYWTGFQHGLITVFIFVSFVIYIGYLPFLISNPKHSYVSGENKLAKKIQSVIPEKEKVLVIGGGLPFAQQAVFLAGRKLELTSINQELSYRSLKTGLSVEVENKTIQQVKELGYWTDQMMEEWIKNEYNFIIIDEGYKNQVSGSEKFKTLIDSFFVKTSTFKIPNRSFGCYQRR